MLACFGGAPARRQPPGCFANSYCDGLRPEKPRASKETAHPSAQQSDADISQAPDDLEPELRSPLDAAQKWPSQPETWGRRSVISPHRALVARPDPESAPGVQDRGKSHGSPSAARELFQLARQASSDEEPMDGATRSVGSDHTRSSSSSEASDEDASL